MVVDVLKKGIGRFAQEMFARLGESVTAWQHKEARQGGGHDDLPPVYFLFQNFGKPDLRMDIKGFAQRTPP